MANLVKITEVNLYSGMTEDVQDCYACKAMLEKANIPFTHLFYNDNQAHAPNFAALSTWSFGPDFQQYTFTKYPLVIWKEFYDDYERFVQVAQSSAELAKSNLIRFAPLVKK
jgi:hypothetical protein